MKPNFFRELLRHLGNIYHYWRGHFPVTVIMKNGTFINEWAIDVINDEENLVIDTADGNAFEIRFSDIAGLLVTAR